MSISACSSLIKICALTTPSPTVAAMGPKAPTAGATAEHRPSPGQRASPGCDGRSLSVAEARLLLPLLAPAVLWRGAAFPLRAQQQQWPGKCSSPLRRTVTRAHSHLLNLVWQQKLTGVTEVRPEGLRLQLCFQGRSLLGTDVFAGGDLRRRQEQSLPPRYEGHVSISLWS